MMPTSRLRAPRLLASLLLPALLLAGHAGAQQAAAPLQPVEQIAAVVNDDVILRSELERAIANIRAQYKGHEDQLPPDNVLERQVLERLILMRLQLARAADAGITATDADIERAVQSVAQQNGMTVDQLRARIAQDGMSFADFRNSLRDEIITQKLRQSFAQGRINVSEAEVDAAMATAAASATQQYRLAHILVGTPEAASPEQIATAQKKIEGVKALIDKGEMSFSAAAVRYSDSPNALEGGDLGWRSLNEIPPAFAAAIQQMHDGEILGPIRGPSGFQLLKLVETRDASQAEPKMVTEYHARHILVRVTPTQDAAAAKAKVDTLRARIAGGADFAAMAKESSEDANTRDDGGELGWFPADAFGPDFGQKIAALQDGQVTEPFRSEAGWHIVQREGSRQTDVADANRRSQVRETIGRRKLEDEYNRFLQEMRGEAFVSFRNQAGENASAAPNGG